MCYARRMDGVFVDRAGYVRTAQGCKLARVDDDGNIWVWDKQAKREVPLRYDMLIELWSTATTTATN